MKSMVAGFMFSADKTWVALIKKEKPEWMKGRWNAVGGHIEDGESPMNAMRREFREETGVDFQPWEQVCHLTWHYPNGHEGEVYFFRAFTDEVHQVRSVTSEQVLVQAVRDIPGLHTVPNLKWLVPMAQWEEPGRGMPYFMMEARWVGTAHDLMLAEVPRRLEPGEDITGILQALAYNACFTGDCEHEAEDACLQSLSTIGGQALVVLEG